MKRTTMGVCGVLEGRMGRAKWCNYVNSKLKIILYSFKRHNINKKKIRDMSV